jgi:hypothetical protein
MKAAISHQRRMTTGAMELRGGRNSTRPTSVIRKAIVWQRSTCMVEAEKAIYLIPTYSFYDRENEGKT